MMSPSASTPSAAIRTKRVAVYYHPSTRTTGREDDFVAKMYFTDDIDGNIELDWWKRKILRWNDEMAAECS